MNFRIVADSSSNLYTFSSVDYATVPLKIVSRNQEYIDDVNLDVASMAASIKAEKTPATTSCPNVSEWLEAFEGADQVFAVSISSNLSGSYNAALQAAGEFKRADKKRRICVLDSLSTGPEMVLIVEKLAELNGEGKDFDTIRSEIRRYMKHTHILFISQSLDNLAKNGRVSPALAKFASALGIRIVGKGSEQGTIELRSKSRGEKKALEFMLSELARTGFRGGKVRMAHCFNLAAASKLQQMIQDCFPGSDVQITTCGGLCTYYADLGGLIVSYEDGL